MAQSRINVTEGEALRAIVHALRERGSDARHYGYDCYLPNVIAMYLETAHQVRHALQERQLIAECSPPFLDAAHTLVHMGVLRLGVVRIDRQSTDDGSGGSGYSLTSSGRAWLADPDTILLPTHPSEMGELLAKHRTQYGDGFHQRAQEAVRCQIAGASLATCVMAGAAAEAILVAIAAAKTGDEEQVLKELKASGGRVKLQKSVTAPLTDSERRALDAYLELLKPWRDVSAHGAISNVGPFEAYEALTRLVRLAIFANDHWAKLTS